MRARAKARRRALEFLFEAEARDVDALSVAIARRENSDIVLNEYSLTILEGVTAHLDRIDEVLESYVKGWTIERMPAVDRMALRIGVWELLYNDEVPDAVAVAEAVVNVRELSTDESPEFVNGVLGRIQSVKDTLVD
ncbi:transcription antitermination factor NusB [Arthrobacter sp. MYb211]|uniref:transcription antitermination factor NusB n=1 Tax=Micrococcaceae TaxID=1268 RepID=UPI000BB6C22B|nr:MULTISPECIES: transcription antitermination factor NusB [Micrococcaceae]PCC29143.1 transcription antitermination factor NusB [Glutamicibacter sp. BW80]PRA01163.1 transcription antitermination factor NusB [Arthrobacter sp. MYb224]PRA06670.1 transcription antitermination factor NusB [Arthrobacter sp. MYb229]PRA13816.1 transcription antitermination factor NusB [Arthrobacter sp. MYb221]PRB53571.1 transcription antitermination factor NusB [Arthrobacter sp. MYb216]